MTNGFVIKNIRLRNFRNYQDKSWSFTDGVNKITGPNAIGKTNLIEAIQLITMIASFRNPKLDDLILNDTTADFAIVDAQIYDSNLDSTFDISLKIVNGKKTYSLNGKNKSIKELKGKFPSVVFTPDDLNIAKGSNSVRRDTIDLLGSQISTEYYTVLRDYNKALKQKNSLLKDGLSKDLLLSINEVLTVCGAQLLYFRLALVNKIKPIISDYYKEIANNDQDLDISYFASYDLDQELSEISRDSAREKLICAYNDFYNTEVNKKKCIIGPHRDKIQFTLGGCDAQNFASQGQQRSIVLALKLTEISLIEKLLNKRPILLLDDVMSELDSSRQSKLLSFIENQTQSFITSAV